MYSITHQCAWLHGSVTLQSAWSSLYNNITSKWITSHFTLVVHCIDVSVFGIFWNQLSHYNQSPKAILLSLSSFIPLNFSFPSSWSCCQLGLLLLFIVHHSVWLIGTEHQFVWIWKTHSFLALASSPETSILCSAQMFLYMMPWLTWHWVSEYSVSGIFHFRHCIKNTLNSSHKWHTGQKTCTLSTSLGTTDGN